MAVSRMSDIIPSTYSVLLQEAVEGLVTAPGGIYVDATFGRGSHSREILSRLNADGRLIAFDKDPEAIAALKVRYKMPVFLFIMHRLLRCRWFYKTFMHREKSQEFYLIWVCHHRN